MLTHPMTGFVELVPLTIVGVDLIALMVALMVTLFVCAGWVILWVLHLALGSISIFGFHPFDFFYNLATDAIKGLWGQMAKRVPAFGHFLWSQVMMVWRPLYVIGATLAGLVTQLVGVSQASQQGLANLQAREDFFIGQLRNQEQTDISNLGLNVLSIEAQLKAKEATDVANLTRTITDDNTTTNARITNDVNSLTNRINTTYTSLANDLQSNVLNLNNRITSVDTVTNTRITNDVNSLHADDVTNLRTAENFATGLVSGLDIAGLRQTLTALSGDVGKIKTETTECLDPLCDTVTPNAPKLGNLGKYLKLLENLGVEAFFLALAIAAVEDPKAVADDLELVLEPLGDLSITVLRDTIGI